MIKAPTHFAVQQKEHLNNHWYNLLYIPVAKMYCQSMFISRIIAVSIAWVQFVSELLLMFV